MNNRDSRVLETLYTITRDERSPKAEREAAQGRIKAIYAKYGETPPNEGPRTQQRTQQRPSSNSGGGYKSPFEDIFGRGFGGGFGGFDGDDTEGFWETIFRDMNRKKSGFSKASQGFSESARQTGKSDNGSEFRYGFHSNAGYQSESEKRNTYRNAYDQRKREEEQARQRERARYKQEFEYGKRWKWEFGKAWEPVKETPLKVEFSEPPCTEAQYSFIVGICRAFGFKVPPRHVSFKNANDFLNIWSPRYKDTQWHKMYREIYDDDFRTHYDRNYGPNIDEDEEPVSHEEQNKRAEYFMQLFRNGVISAEEMETLLRDLKMRR